MALNIKTQLSTTEGFTAFPCYARIEYAVFATGKYMNVGIKYWISEEAYRNGFNEFRPQERIDGFTVEFDKNVNGDPLQYAHLKAIDFLHEKGVNAQMILL